MISQPFKASRAQKIALLMAAAARQGLEPRYSGPKPDVLPLDDRAIIAVVTIYHNFA
jgi:hypothetical protein